MSGNNFHQLSLPFDTNKKIDTVRGEVLTSQLGGVLMHEHVFCRVRPQHRPAAARYIKGQIQKLKEHGIRTIVDLTTYVLPDQFVPFLLEEDFNIICCAGYYTKNKVPKSYLKLDDSVLTDKLLGKVVKGIGKYRIKPSIIKVASSGRNLDQFERNIFTAAARVQQTTKLPIATHSPRGGRKQLEHLLKNGANPKKVFFSHMEMELKGISPSTVQELINDLLWILQQGAYIFFGDFSVQNTSYRHQVIQVLRTCCERGFEEQIFISTDSYWAHRNGVIKVRGNPITSKMPRSYTYTVTLIKPLLLKNGFTPSMIHKFLFDNPVTFFSN